MQHLASEDADLSCHFVQEPINREGNLGSVFLEQYQFTYIFCADWNPSPTYKLSFICIVIQLFEQLELCFMVNFSWAEPPASPNIKINLRYFKPKQFY